MNKSVRIFVLVLIVSLVGLFVYKEIRRFQNSSTICYNAREIYEEFLDSAVCTNPRLRYLFEYKDLIKCSEVEELLVEEDVMDCTIHLWLKGGPFGYMVFTIGGNIYEKVTSYLSMISLTLILGLCGLILFYRKQNQSQNKYMANAFAIGLIQGAMNNNQKSFQDHFNSGNNNQKALQSYEKLKREQSPQIDEL